MTLYVFTGPTLSAEQGRKEIDAVFLPPAAQGDVYRAALERPAAIAIIDGYFERVPSVSHKEILWAMSQGVHVFGAASMGALRAAELARFGMEGVGAIYRAYASGEIDADDEVAVAHATAEDGYRPTSEALVNIRATLRAAEQAGALSAAARADFERIAKGLFYPDRCYPILLSRAAEEGAPPAEIEALQAFLPNGRVNQKRLDALEMLRLLRERFAGAAAPKRVDWHFEHTDAWEHIRESARRNAFAPGAGAPDPVLEELKLAGGYAVARRGALARVLAIEAARRRNRSVQGAPLVEAIEAFRRARGLFQPADIQRWLDEQALAGGAIERFFQDEAHVQWIDALFGAEAERYLVDHLRSTGAYASLRARAAAPAGPPEAGKESK
jgi:hypothetical protein